MELTKYINELKKEIKREAQAVYKSKILFIDIAPFLREDVICLPDHYSVLEDFLLYLDVLELKVDNVRGEEIVTINQIDLNGSDYDYISIRLPLCFGHMTEDQIIRYCNDKAEYLLSKYKRE